MDYENCALSEFAAYKQPIKDTKEVVRISVKKGEMTTHKMTKTKLSQVNVKRSYFPSGILSLPFGHLPLKEVDKYKKNKGQRIEIYFWSEKEYLLELGKKALKATSRLEFLNNILLKKPKIVSFDCTKFDRNTQYTGKRDRKAF